MPRSTMGLSDLVGNTPLVDLERLLDGAAGPRVVAKLEMANPGGSAKDRPADRMLRHALSTGALRPGDTVVESSSGNLGVALAQQTRWHGLDFVCVVDPRTNTSTRRLIEAYGGRVHEVTEPDPATGDWLVARIAAVHALLESLPGAYWPNQYANEHNARAHAEGTMSEILDDLGGDLAAVLVATSSTGTVNGCLDEVGRRGLDTRVVAVDAVGSVLFGGAQGTRLLPGFGAGAVPPLSLRARPDRLIRVSDLDCVRGCRRLVDREALLVGASGGGVVSALAQVLDDVSPADTVALVLHDGGARYLDTVYDDRWVREHLHQEPEDISAHVAQPFGDLVQGHRA